MVTRAKDNGHVVITGAARRYTKQNFGQQQQQAAASRSGRQEQAWTYWHDTPEVGFAATWIGNQMGRARLFAGRRADDGSVEQLPPEHPASELVSQIAGGPTGQAQLLTEFGPHLVMAGEGWIIIEPTTFGEKWHVVSVLEVKARGGSLEVELEGVPRVVPIEDDATPVDETAPIGIRVWQPFPGRHIEADSPVMRSFALLDELRLLNAAVAAIAKSRLTGRGIVFVPQGTKFPTAAGSEGEEDDLLDTLLTVAETAYGDPNSAAAAVPIFLEVPADFIGQVQKMTFESNFDDIAVKLREECIRRFATGLDTPAEVLLGMGEANHWGQWAIDESAVRIAIEPRLANVCEALTSQWLLPALDAEVIGSDEVLVWYDVSDLRPKVNRGQTAVELYDRGEITGDALRRETQFDDADKPNDQQRREAILLGIVKAAPSLAPIILPLLGIKIEVPADGALPPDEGGDAEPPEVDLPVDEERSPPDEVGPPPPEVVNGAGLLAAADGLVVRALERAGQRYKSRTSRNLRSALNDVNACSVHTTAAIMPEAIDELGLLEGAWDRVPEVANRYGIDADSLAGDLDRYCRELIAAGVEHNFNQMPAVLVPLTNRSLEVMLNG